MNLVKATFKNRPNRFIAEVEIDGKEEIAHVPNTGRCRELLIPGVTVYLEPSDNPKRKTRFSLHFVENRNELVSLYSQEANSIVFEAIKSGKIKELSGYLIHEREKTIGNSRIDIHLANNKEECFVEVKGVTLIKDDVAQFPDAPTERGAKHLKELINIKKSGNRAVVFFLIQHPAGNAFRPNWEGDSNFSRTLAEAYEKGVEILVYKCNNTLEGIEFVPKSLKFNLSK